MSDAANPEMTLFDRLLQLHAAVGNETITEFAAVQALVEEYNVPRYEADELMARDAFGEPACEPVRLFMSMEAHRTVRAAEQLLETDPGELGR